MSETQTKEVEETAEAQAPVEEARNVKTKALGEMGTEDASQDDQAGDSVSEMAGDFIGQIDPPEEVEAEPVEEVKPEPEPAAEEEASPPVEAAKPKEEPAAEAAPKEEKPEEEAIDLSKLEQPKAPTQEELKAAWLEQREQMLPELAKSLALSDEEAAELEANPGKVLPNMMARVQLDAMEQTYYALMQGLPNIVGQMMQAQRTVEQHERAFFQEWPGLRGQDSDTIASCITAFRKTKPNCTPEQAIKGGGMLAALQFGLDVEQARGKVAQAAQPQPQPQAPFKPAGAGNAGGPVQPARPSSNPFTQMAEELLNE